MGKQLSTPSFRGKDFFLSNFYSCNVTIEGITYPSSEHAFVAYKTLDRGKRKEISLLDTPGQAKRFGRTLKLRSNWEEVKLMVMYRVVLYKFIQNPALLDALLATGKRKLEERNNWNDTFWGTCNGKGSNWLGKILMQVRKDLTAWN